VINLASANQIEIIVIKELMGKYEIDEELKGKYEINPYSLVLHVIIIS
jgi:hypothetical protein